MKRLKKDEFNYEHSYVRKASVTPSDPRHYMVAQGNDKWENMRYCLEKHMGFFKFTLPMKVVQNSYLTAVYQYSVSGAPPGTPLTSKTQVYGGDILVVTRLPQPKHLHAYIPAKYWSDLGDVPDQSADVTEQSGEAETKSSDCLQLTEEEKLEALLQQQSTADVSHGSAPFLPPIVVRMLKQKIQHPTDYASLTTPHPLFVCQYCSAQGKHFHSLCPYVETDARQNTAELITKVRRIVGIPKSRLRPATPEEVTLGQYYLNENNDKVVVLPLSQQESQPTSPPPKLQSQPPLSQPAAAKRKEEPLELPIIVLDEAEYEAQLRFDFEDFIEEQDKRERLLEAQFYEKHPELRKKKNQICTHYYRGMCHKGKLECEFLHSGDETYIAICQFFVNDQCTDANCMFRHPDKQLFNNECNAFKRGFCEKGRLCKYKHVKYVHPSDSPDLEPDTVKLMVSALMQRLVLSKRKRQ